MSHAGNKEMADAMMNHAKRESISSNQSFDSRESSPKKEDKTQKKSSYAKDSKADDGVKKGPKPSGFRKS